MATCPTQKEFMYLVDFAWQVIRLEIQQPVPLEKKNVMLNNANKSALVCLRIVLVN